MDTNQQIKKQSQKVNRLERRLAIQKLKARRARTRQLIELGGLVVKAKMDGFQKPVVLGALIDARENIQREPSTETLFKAKGDAAFMGFNEGENG
jgi:ribosomal protein L4